MYLYVLAYDISPGIPLLVLLSPVTVALWSLGNGCVIPFEYVMAEALQLSYLGAFGLLTDGLEKRKTALAYYNQNDLPYWDIALWAPFAALFGIVFGLAFCCVAFMFISLCLSPKLLYCLIRDLWSEPLDPNRVSCKSCILFCFHFFCL